MIILRILSVEVLSSHFMTLEAARVPGYLCHIYMIGDVWSILSKCVTIYAIFSHLTIVRVQVGHRVASRAQVDIRLCPDQFDFILSYLVTRSNHLATVTLDTLKVVLAKFALADLTVAL